MYSVTFDHKVLTMMTHTVQLSTLDKDRRPAEVYSGLAGITVVIYCVIIVQRAGGLRI